ncbi:HK97 family phage prohead protease [Novosphingobium profundi]|uniref:HK97 family phage prohead protease n=1 Tax=Novosphingobium profundi TaxID=1774954 RepID=UPI001BDB3AFD|nr:HK97 family phage prohead protease [Novosphingobium profundi]MBT0671272.1 HK97 family phage prohead protease [Novosphingobium profundi]
MTMQFLTKSFKAAPIKENEVEGLASTYGNIDHVGDIVERGAYARTIDAFNRSKKGMPFLAHHRHDRPIGRITELRDTDEGLWFRAEFSKSHDGQNVREQFLDGTLDSFSIGYRVLQKAADRVNGQKVLRLKEISLHEISAVTFPCNELATLSAVKGDISSSFPNLSLEDQQRVADFAAQLEANQIGSLSKNASNEEAQEAIKALELEQDEAMNRAFEDAFLAYRIKQTFNR